MKRSTWSTVHESTNHQQGQGGQGGQCMLASMAGVGARGTPVRQGSGVLQHGQLKVFAVGQAGETAAGAVAAVPTAAR